MKYGIIKGIPLTIKELKEMMSFYTKGKWNKLKANKPKRRNNE